ncbi:hypothetical protein JCM33374_g2010 [Metschnikowia sp. JCM 33374]|nr:hypothetical protein JCM33374_g2010 [Metschnikowia sp. JCM 33374]
MQPYGLFRPDGVGTMGLEMVDPEDTEGQYTGGFQPDTRCCGGSSFTIIQHEEHRIGYVGRNSEKWCIDAKPLKRVRSRYDPATDIQHELVKTTQDGNSDHPPHVFESRQAKLLDTKFYFDLFDVEPLVLHGSKVQPAPLHLLPGSRYPPASPGKTKEQSALDHANLLTLFDIKEQAVAASRDRPSHLSSLSATPQPATATALPTSEGSSGSPLVNNDVRESSVDPTSFETGVPDYSLAKARSPPCSMIAPTLSVPECDEQSYESAGDYGSDEEPQLTSRGRKPPYVSKRLHTVSCADKREDGSEVNLICNIEPIDGIGELTLAPSVGLVEELRGEMNKLIAQSSGMSAVIPSSRSGEAEPGAEQSKRVPIRELSPPRQDDPKLPRSQPNIPQRSRAALNVRPKDSSPAPRVKRKEVVDFEGPSAEGLSKQEILSKVTNLYEHMVCREGTLLGPHWEQPGRWILQGFWHRYPPRAFHRYQDSKLVGVSICSDENKVVILEQEIHPEIHPEIYPETKQGPSETSSQQEVRDWSSEQWESLNSPWSCTCLTVLLLTVTLSYKN